jgi:paraquat-inducible protein B
MACRSARRWSSSASRSARSRRSSSASTNPATKFVVPVTIEVEPQVVRTKSGEQIDLRDRETLRRLVERGLRGAPADAEHPHRPALRRPRLPSRQAGAFVAPDPAISEIPTIRTAVQELTRKLEGFPMDTFLADVAAIGASLNQTLNTPETRNLPRRLDATLKHLESLAARLDAKSGPILEETRADLAEMKKALVAAQAAMARLESAADRVGALADADSELVRNLTRPARNWPAPPRRCAGWPRPNRRRCSMPTRP